MSLSITARRPAAVRAKSPRIIREPRVVPTQKQLSKGYTPLQSPIASKTRAAAGVAATTGQNAPDHKKANLLKSLEVRK